MFARRNLHGFTCFYFRYEAKELVRSLQSSRTSLEKAGLRSEWSSVFTLLGEPNFSDPYLSDPNLDFCGIRIIPFLPFRFDGKELEKAWTKYL
jgi:hypothetical protein